MIDVDEREFPFKAWLLTASFNLKEVELVKTNESWNWTKVLISEQGTRYLLSDLYETLEDAICAGFLTIEKREAALQRHLKTQQKRRKNLLAARCKYGDAR